MPAVALMQRLAGLTRLELATFRVTGERSNQTELQPQNITLTALRSSVKKENFKITRLHLKRLKPAIRSFTRSMAPRAGLEPAT